MTDQDRTPIAALTELGRGLQGALRTEASVRARRRRRGRLAAAMGAGVFVLGGVATAASIIDVGTPVRDARDIPGAPAPAGTTTLAATAEDPAGGAPWGVRVFNTADGRRCAIVGRVRVGRLGEVRDGVFHPYGADRRGVCANAAPGRTWRDITKPENGVRAIYGRAGQGVRRVRVTVGEDVREVLTGPTGTFLVLVTADVAAETAQTTPLP